MGTFEEVDARSDILPPGNSNTMPCVAGLVELVFWMLEHVGGRDLEVVVREVLVESILIMVRKPYFLEEDQ